MPFARKNDDTKFTREPKGGRERPWDHRCKTFWLGPGRGGGLVVIALAFFSDDPCLNPAESLLFFRILLFERTKINKKTKPGLAHLKNILALTSFYLR